MRVDFDPKTNEPRLSITKRDREWLCRAAPLLQMAANNGFCKAPAETVATAIQEVLDYVDTLGMPDEEDPDTGEAAAVPESEDALGDALPLFTE